MKQTYPPLYSTKITFDQFDMTSIVYVHQDAELPTLMFTFDQFDMTSIVNVHQEDAELPTLMFVGFLLAM
ncbi:hypothetical protein PAHAL_9G618900 [Panicum hallii]|jgi:uncharacterized protein with GYD domain|uniref:Uncharacterized protein n=1 Tax=Panicum hallii TaxID=206008 RepID=A0A2T8I6I7_9POAL|nr:hypothetical protein PAHAL_9G618900 [Panicum hallii]